MNIYRKRDTARDRQNFATKKKNRKKKKRVMIQSKNYFAETKEEKNLNNERIEHRETIRTRYLSNE